MTRPTSLLRRAGATATAAVATAAMTLGVASTAAQADSGGADRHGRTTAVLDWDAEAGRAATIACVSPLVDPLHESRMYTMASLAVHDVLNAIDRRAESYESSFRAPRYASVDAAVAAAAHDTLVSGLQAITDPWTSCVGPAVDDVDSFYATKLAAIPDGLAKTAGLEAGQHAARAIIAMRAHDGSDTQLIWPDFPQGTAPGEYRFTPGSDFAFATQWGNDEATFALRTARQFKSGPPLPLDSARYARDFNEVKAYGGDGSTTPTLRNAWQTEVAHFWWESSPLMWNAIARTLAVQKHLDPWEQARLLALLNMGLADGYTAVFAEKYDYLFWRPVTAIRAAATDGNPATSPDPSWTPLEVTPAIPDHPSGHSVEGGVAAGVFRQFFGTDQVSFSACSVTVTTGPGTCDSANPILHHFTSFTQAAQENAESRIWIGFHFRYATQLGTAEGVRIGDWTATRLLRPRT